MFYWQVENITHSNTSLHHTFYKCPTQSRAVECSARAKLTEATATTNLEITMRYLQKLSPKTKKAVAYLGGALGHAPPPLLTPTFSKKEQRQWCQVTEICQILLMVSVAYGQGRIQGGRMIEEYASSTGHFQKCF